MIDMITNVGTDVPDGKIITAVVTSNQAITVGISNDPAPIKQLSVELAKGRYILRMMVLFQMSSAEIDASISHSYSAGVTVVSKLTYTVLGTALQATSTAPVVLEGFIEISAASVCVPKFTQNTAADQTITVRSGSYVTFIKVA